MIARLFAALLCLSASDSSGAAWPREGAGHDGQVLQFDNNGVGRWIEHLPNYRDLMRHARWRFVLYFYGRAIVVDGWESERECREMRDRMRRQYPDARITDCEESR